MKLQFIPLGKLHRSRSNMRFSRKAPDVTDILPSIRARGVLMPILVRPEADEAGDGFGVIAGDRRFTAASIVAEEIRSGGGDPEPMPCAILEEGDDAAALEASLIENLQRLDPDEVTRWERFSDLVRQGRTIDEIATTFGLPELAVRRTLALGNLLPRVRTLYRGGEIDATTVRHMTLASKSQQRDWLKLHDDPDAFMPTGHQLKSWLFGGQSIACRHALFEQNQAKLAIIADLFGEGGYFADSAAFWAAQNEAVDARRTAYVEAGWSKVVILSPTEHYASWEMEKTPKRKGGAVYIDVRASGEVCIHEGYLTSKEARARARGETVEKGVKPVRPEMTSGLVNYVDLHRHAAVRLALSENSGVAMRLMVAHALAGSHLWRVDPDPRRAQSDAIADSAESSPAEAGFDTRRRAAQAFLGYPDDEPGLLGRHARTTGMAELFSRLMALPDPVVHQLIAMVMSETLASGDAIIETLGVQLGVDMADWWEADDTFFGMVRDREVLAGMVAEVAGETVAKANASEKAKTLKTIIRAHLDGADGRTKVERWVPRWMRFAPSAYTDRGGVPTVERTRQSAPRTKEVEDDFNLDEEAGDLEEAPLAA